MENDIWSECKTFQPAKWGFVHIPEYHYTGEQAIVSAVRADGGISRELVLTVGGGNRHAFSEGFLRGFDKLLSRDGWAVGQSNAQATARLQAQLCLVLAKCSQKGETVSFDNYYNSQWWISVRDWLVWYEVGGCSLCGSNDNLHVHHKTYKRIGCEAVTDLSVLCSTCHGLWHKAKKGADAYQKIQNFMTAFKELERSL